MRIALIHWEHPVQIHSAQIANYFVRMGHIVHFFLIDVDQVKGILTSIPLDDRVVCHRHETRENDIFFFLFRLARKVIRLISGKRRLGDELGDRILLRRRSSRILSFFSKHFAKFDFSIGVEKNGLFCSKLLQQATGTPYCYYSLELYNDEHPFVQESFWLNLLRSYEIAAHKDAIATIVQDPQRAAVLYASNGLKESHPPVFFLPVSLDCDSMDKFCLSAERPLNRLLLFGISRMTGKELADLSKNLPPQYHLLIHNFNVEKERNILQEWDLRNVLLSSEHYGEGGIRELVGSSRIGLCWYLITSENDRLTAFSSEKLARFMAQGIPIVARSESNFEELFQQYRCGEVVHDSSEIGKAIEKIEKNYIQYSEAAFEAYQHFFSFTNNFAEFEPFVRNLLVMPQEDIVNQQGQQIR